MSGIHTFPGDLNELENNKNSCVYSSNSIFTMYGSILEFEP
jgi:hypothetical protein